MGQTKENIPIRSDKLRQLHGIRLYGTLRHAGSWL